MNRDKSIAQIRIQLREKLGRLNEGLYPNVTTLVRTEEGYRQIEDQVIRYASQNNVALDTAIWNIEMDF